jgi:hypothetical protein
MDAYAGGALRYNRALSAVGPTRLRLAVFASTPH